jgi:multidrug efflux pump subunit AcrB
VNPGDKPGWLERPVAALCLILGLWPVSVFVITGSGKTKNSGGRELGFSITIRHYGVDAREMERTTAIPLEDARSSIAGVKQVLSSSENGRVRVFVRFDRPAPGRYEAVREAAQTVYESLPASAQRPEILSSSGSGVPVWIAAVFGPGDWDAGDRSLGGLPERVIKPAIKGIPGAGEVEISGAGLPEIVVTLKPEEAAARGLTASVIASALGKNDLLLPGGSLRVNGREILIMVDGRHGDIFSLEKALIPLNGGPPVPLGEVAFIREGDRTPDTRSRLNGRDTVIISVMAGADADLGALSRSIKGELEKFKDLPLEFEILSDRGAEEAAAFGSVLGAAMQGAAMVALTAALLVSGKGGAGRPGFRRRRIALICALTVPFICVISAALLILLGLFPDRALLAGLGAGVGAAVDAAILSSEALGRVRSVSEGKRALGRLRAPLISGSVTTIAALLPLTVMESLAGNVKSVAWAIGMVTLVSLITALVPLPPLFLWGLGRRETGNRYGAAKDPPRPVSRRFFCACFRGCPGLSPRVRRAGTVLRRKIFRRGFRALAAAVGLCVNRPAVPLIGGALLSAGGIAALIFAGADITPEISGDSVYAQVEFEGGLLAEETDRLLASYAGKLKTQEGIANVQTSARTASGSVLVNFDPKKTGPDAVRALLRSTVIPGGFVYIPETSPSERIWKITVSGDDDAKCRELAEEMARRCAALPLVRETVLNFKDGSGRLTLKPDRERLLGSGVLFSSLAGTVRRGVHGPVAYKRIGTEGETDLRVRGLGFEAPSRKELEGLLIRPEGEGHPLRLDSLMGITEGREPASIRREDRRRVASISVRTKPMDPRSARDRIMGALETMGLPPGYGVEFDREAVMAAEALSGTALFFLLALLFCYMVIAGTNESFGLPLAVLSVVPPSLAVPALCLIAAGFQINAAGACAFVAVCGMAVNASVLTADELRFSPALGERSKALGFYRALRRRLPALLATGGTTIAGAIPFLFLREGANAVVRVLSLVTALGVGSSCLCSLTIIPALAAKFSNLFISFEASRITEP